MAEPLAPSTGSVRSDITEERSPTSFATQSASYSAFCLSVYAGITVTSNSFVSVTSLYLIVAVNLPVTFSFPASGRVTFATPFSIVTALFPLTHVISDPFAPFAGSSISPVTAVVSPRSNSSLSAATIPASFTLYIAAICSAVNALL